MTDDDLRRRLSDADPAGDASITPVNSPDARALLEDIMNTGTNEVGRNNRGSKLAIVGAVAAAAVLAVGGVALWGGDAEPEVAEPTATTAPLTIAEPAPTTVQPIERAALTLSLGQGQDPMASCIRPDPTVAAMVELGFLGTVAELDGERVVLDVDRWYVGGDSARVELTAPSGLEALLGTVDFVVGGQFVVSATSGVVNYCGLSGPADELQAMYDAAFPG